MSNSADKIGNHQLLGFGILMALAVIIYWPGLDGPMILDDYPQLGQFFNNNLLSTKQLKDAAVSDSGKVGRPVSMLTFIGNYIINSNNLFSWKLTNLIIHLLCGLGLYLFLRIVEQAVYLRWNKKLPYLALVGASIWLLHPLQVSTVLYLVQRMAQLSALFMILGLWAYSRGRLRLWSGQAGMQWIWASGLIFLPLAVLSKENGALLPLLIILLEIFIFGFEFRHKDATALKLFFVICIAIPLTAGFLFLIANLDTIVMNGYEGRPFTLTERLLTQTRVICMYLLQIIWPSTSSMRFFYENYPISQSFFAPITTAIAIAAIVILIGSAWWARKRLPIYSFGIFFYFVSISMESSIFPLELAFEHRNYLALLGGVLALYSLVVKIIEKKPFRVALYIFAVFVLCLNTSARAAIWSSKTDFYNYHYRLNPDSPRIVSTLAEELTRQHKYDDALRLLAGNNSNGSKLQAIYVQCIRGDDLRGVDYMRLAQSITSPLDNYVITGIVEVANLGLDDICKVDLPGFELFLEQIMDRRYRNRDDKYKLQLYRAHYIWKQGMGRKALSFLETLSEKVPSNPIPLFLAAEWALDMGAREAAREYYSEAIRRARSSPEDYIEYKQDISKRMTETESAGG